MIDTIQEILSSPAGSFSFIFGLMVLVGWPYDATRFTTKIAVKHDQFNYKMNKTEVNVDEIRKDMAFVKGSLEVAIMMGVLIRDRYFIEQGISVGEVDSRGPNLPVDK